MDQEFGLMGSLKLRTPAGCWRHWAKLAILPKGQYTRKLYFVKEKLALYVRGTTRRRGMCESDT